MTRLCRVAQALPKPAATWAAPSSAAAKATMKIRYFEDTDTLLIELKPGRVAETRERVTRGRDASILVSTIRAGV